VGDVRGIGLLWGVEVVSDKCSKQTFPPHSNFAALVTAAALKRGLLVYPIQGCVDGVSGDHLLIAPPGVITAEQIDWAVQQLRDSIEDAAAPKRVRPAKWLQPQKPKQRHPKHTQSLTS